MEIIKYPNPILRTVSEGVKLPLSKEDSKLLDEMFNYVKEHQDEAVGLSAVQVGVPKRMCVIRFKGAKGTTAYKLVNPKVMGHSSKMMFNSEGCLSVDEQHDEKIGRWSSIKVWAYDAITKMNVCITATGYEAIVLQHELDHMDGKLYIDYLNK